MLKDLIIENLSVETDKKQVLSDINLEIKTNQIHVLMGPNGSGKSSLTRVLMGHPNYKVINGSIKLGEDDITNYSPDKRAALGLFTAFQYPKEIPGVKMLSFLRSIYNNKQKHLDQNYKPASIFKFKQQLEQILKKFKIDPSMLERYLNTGFSGGEKKKFEILQMALLKPNMAILDEIDSGLDVDALQTIFQQINELKQSEQMSLLIITHYNRIFKYITPDKVHVLVGSKIVKSDGAELLEQIENKGFDWLK